MRQLKKLIPQPAQLEQLTLEITKVNDGLSDWISQARGLRELDMSWTPVGDEFLNSIQGCRELSVLWMTELSSRIKVLMCLFSCKV